MEKERVAGSAFGALLRRHRLAAGLSQEVLAERARMSVNGIGALERGDRRYPYRETVVLLAKALALKPTAAAELEAAAARPRQRHTVDRGAAAVDGDALVTNLPLTPSSLIGREDDIADIVRILETSRLVTVTGAGGVGKTRMALAVGEALVGDTKHGVWVVELAPVPQGSFVASTVARALNVQDSLNSSLLETLLAYLKRKSALLILDNCEHVIGEAAALADAILRGCPNVQILATSREPLRIAGEQAYRLPSLRVPAAADNHGLSAAEAVEFSAVELFAQRAQAIDRGFALSDHNAAIVAEICRRLDGIPLAIELAAARISILSVKALSERLGQRLRVLTHGDRSAPTRHQTIRALIDWSYDLLSPQEQRLFDSLSIFAGGCTLGAATAVCGAQSADALTAGRVSADEEVAELDVLDRLSSLIDKSLVFVEPLRDELRYKLLETTRAYALEKLTASGRYSPVAQQHAAWVAEFADRAHDLRLKLPALQWLSMVAPELDNARAAIGWAFAAGGDAAVGARVAIGFTQAWNEFGFAAEGRHLIEIALDRMDAGVCPSIVAQLWLSAAYLRRGEQRAAKARRALDLFERVQDLVGLARACFQAGLGYVEAAEYLEGAACILRAIITLREIGMECSLDYARALTYHAAALSCLGKFDEARTEHNNALALYTRLGGQREVAGMRIHLAENERNAGDLHRAIELTGEAAAGARGLGDTRRESLALNNSAAYHLELGNISDAVGFAHRGLELALNAGWEIYVTYSVQHLATIAALQNDPRRAARLVGYVDQQFRKAACQREPTERWTYETLVTALRKQLTNEQIETLAAEGAQLDEDQAVTMARAITRSTTPAFYR